MTDTICTLYCQDEDRSHGTVMRHLLQCMLRSFRYHNKTATIRVYSDVVDWMEGMKPCCVIPFPVKSYPWRDKPRIILDTMDTSKEGDRILYVDTDVIFLDDPFRMDNPGPWNRISQSHYGCTSRPYEYKYKTTSAFQACIAGDKSRKILSQYDSFVPEKTAVSDMEFASLMLETGQATDLGWYWDFYPGAESCNRELSKTTYCRAAKSRSVGAIHLKGDMKYMIYEKEFQNLVEIQ
jgi:hypothetical protein